MSKSNILLIGSGGVGTVAAYALESNGKSTVTAVIRSDYKAALETGYDIESCNYGSIKNFRPSHIVSTVQDANQYGPFDYVVVTTKNQPDVFRAEDLVEPAITEKTCIVLIQNGYGIEKDVIKRYPNHIVLSGVQMISSTLYHMKVSHVGDDSMKLGYFDNGSTPKEEQEAVCKKFISLYSNDKNECIYDEKVNYTRWRKLIYNATLNSVCTICNIDVGRVEAFGGLDPLIRPAMREIIALAKCDGVELQESDMEFMIRSDDGEWYAPSMCVDLRKGNYIEHEVIVGNALKVGKEHGIETPVLSTLYSLLSLIQMRTKEAKKVINLPEQRPDGPYVVKE